MERFKQVSRSERASVLYKDIFFYFAGKRFFFIYSWCDFFTGKRKTLCTILLRYIRYVSSDWRQFHPHMHACTYCVCGRACVRACGQACVCVCQADTHIRTYILCPNYEDPSRETRFRIHMYVCIYVCIYLSIERESVCVRNKSIVCGNRFVFTPFVCIMYELCVIECVCIPLFFFEKTQTHTTHTLSTPAVAEYLPAGHDVQAAAAEEVDPAGPCVPAAHTEPEQVEAPTTAEYLPASQLVH